MPPAAGGRRPGRITTHGSQTARRCAKRSRAWLVSSPLNGHGVAPFGNNRRPCLEQPEAAEAATVL
ncbi:MAG: hypothetical protein LBD24_02205 [Spirochaetaceae bacterium]|nr:hypothetical protein [Spirochaetaceae bacterium]